MAEAQSRPSATRGRGSGRAGRGGFSSRGGRSAPRTSNGDSSTAQPALSLEEQGEMGQLKKGYATELETLKELFADWTDDDLVLALEDTDGDLPRTIERISEGNVSQFSDVKKKTKEKTRGKKDVPGGSEAATNSTRGRARGGLESVRGGRGRGSDRGGRGRGGRGGSTTNGARSASAAVSVPTTETTGWGAAPTTSIAVGGVDGTVNTEPWDQSAGAGDDSWADKTSNDAAPNSEILKSSLIPSGTKKSWASMLSAPKAPPVVPKPQAPVQAQHAANAPPAEISAASSASLTGDVAKDLTQTPPAASLSATDLGIELAPPKDKLTEDNLEHLPDESQPIASETVASTRDASSVVGSGTPFAASQQGPGAARPPLGGYATTAWKAAGTPGRSASFQKKILEQREAVVMPGNHAVDRAAVQFGSMGLNGDGKPLDVDDDREETQTRAPVAHSPPSQPRASLPPASHPHAAGPETMGHAHEGGPTPKQAPGLPFSGQQPPPSSAGPGAQQGPYGGQYGRYGAGTLGQETASTGQKPYDAFAQQVNYGQTQDPSSIFPNNSQAANASAPTQSHGGYSQNPSEYSSQYGGDQQRFQNYYGGGYGQQGHHASHQEQNVGPQRSGSAFAGAEPAYAANQPGASQSRFNENQNTSGHTTPNPALSSQQGSGQSQQVHHAQGQPQGQAAQGGGYPYGNPYYSGSYYGGGSYMNQYSNNYYNQQQGYGAPYGGKGNMYGQPHHGYGMSPQTSYEQSASPANAGGFSNNMRGSDNALSGGLGEYGRSGSTQPTQQSTSASGSYTGNAGESYGRGAGGAYSNQQYGQQDETLKPFGGESKGGPSPSLSQPGRAGSATNNAGYGAGQSNYQQQQQQQSQQGFGGYPNHLNQGSAYGGIGGLGGSHQGSAQSHQTGGYGGYGGFGNNNYQYGRGGWGSNNYGH